MLGLRGFNVPPGLNNVVAIAAGRYHVLVLTPDGCVLGWGNNNWGQTSIPSGLSNVVAIAAGIAHSLALTAEWQVVGWGAAGVDIGYGQAITPTGLSNVVAIAAGGLHSVALTTEGRVVGWGYNGEGQTNIPSGLSNVVSIAAASEHSLAVTAEGRVVGWGRNYYGQLNIPAGLTNTPAIAGGDGHSLALSGDGFPIITRQPVSQLATAGADISFQVWPGSAPGTPPLRYQWRKADAPLSGQTKARLLVVGVTPIDTGNYQVMVSTFSGLSATSSVATLTVNCLLNTTATVGGSAIRNPDLALYPGNSQATLTATVEPGYAFIRWSGDAAGSTNPLVVTLDTNKGTSINSVPMIVIGRGIC